MFDILGCLLNFFLFSQAKRMLSFCLFVLYLIFIHLSFSSVEVYFPIFCLTLCFTLRASSSYGSISSFSSLRMFFLSSSLLPFSFPSFCLSKIYFLHYFLEPFFFLFVLVYVWGFPQMLVIFNCLFILRVRHSKVSLKPEQSFLAPLQFCCELTSLDWNALKCQNLEILFSGKRGDRPCHFSRKDSFALLSRRLYIWVLAFCA